MVLYIMTIKIRYNTTIDFNIPIEFKNTSGIYKITNNKTNQIYIGRTKNFYNRYLMYKTNIKHGYFNFKICSLILKNPGIKFNMELVESTKDIIKREEFYIKKFDCVNSGLNVIYTDSELYDKNRGKEIKSSPEYKEYLSLLRKERKLKKEKSQTESVNITKQPLIPEYIINENTDLHSPKISKLIESFGFTTSKTSFYIRDEITNKFKRCSKKQFIKACQQKELESKILI